MADEIIIISTEDRHGWEAEHEQGGLPSQSWAYANALRASGIGATLAVVRAQGARMLMPYFEREWMGHTDVATVLGLSGASISPSSSAPLSLWREYAAQKGWVAGYIQLAPSVELKGSLGDDELVSGNQVFMLDLRVDVLRSASEIVRRKVRKAGKLGAVMVDDRSLIAESLVRLYPSSMRRVGAGPQYDFSAETLVRWAMDPSSVVLGGLLGDAVEAVSTFCVAGRRAEYHINAASPRGRDLAAWLIHGAIMRLRERGVELLNLGGGVRPGDGVYRFKERFNAAPAGLRAVLQIYDRATYDELCRTAGVTTAGAWFPAYRTGARVPSA